MKNYYMHTSYIKLSLIVLLMLLFGCKKETTINSTPPAAINKLVIDDGPLSASLGRRIRYTEGGTFTWGKNSNELIASANGKLMRVDLLTKQEEEIVSSQVIITGRDLNNIGLILAGRINGITGYFEYNFDTKKTEEILSVEENTGTRLNKSGNNLFFFTEKITPQPPCNGYCWGIYSGVDTNANFSYLDFATKKGLSLKNKMFACFSTDGTKALLNSQDSFFIFDISSKRIIDSFHFDYSTGLNLDFNYPTFFYDSEPKFITSLITGEMSVRKLRTGEELQKIPPFYPFSFLNFKWSADGTKVYYIGTKCRTCNTNYLGIFDLTTNQEKIIIENVAEAAELATDNNRILVKVQNDYYIRDVN